MQHKVDDVEKLIDSDFQWFDSIKSVLSDRVKLGESFEFFIFNKLGKPFEFFIIQDALVASYKKALVDELKYYQNIKENNSSHQVDCAELLRKWILTYHRLIELYLKDSQEKNPSFVKRSIEIEIESELDNLTTYTEELGRLMLNPEFNSNNKLYFLGIAGPLFWMSIGIAGPVIFLTPVLLPYFIVPSIMLAACFSIAACYFAISEIKKKNNIYAASKEYGEDLFDEITIFKENRLSFFKTLMDKNVTLQLVKNSNSNCYSDANIDYYSDVNSEVKSNSDFTYST